MASWHPIALWDSPNWMRVRGKEVAVVGLTPQREHGQHDPATHRPETKRAS
ncbi:MAG TPA: hypothetical protein VGS19_08855 [Streptosporangiaceae bacterium]|nr:hypothetical protein [Streptosporangiaceae bacterium]